MRKKTVFGLLGLLVFSVSVAYLVVRYMNTVAKPNLIAALIRANETTARTALKNYASAQKKFAERNLAGITGNVSPGLGDKAFADNFRNLYFGDDGDGGLAALISPGAANAYLEPTRGAPTRKPGGSVDQRREPFAGYYFIEDLSGDVPPSRYNARFALMAFPARPASPERSGTAVYWIDENEDVYRYDVPPSDTLDDLVARFRGVPGSTPAGGGGEEAGWTKWRGRSFSPLDAKK